MMDYTLGSKVTNIAERISDERANALQRLH